jgi:RNA polymerase sigma factor (sigma-70 family)
LKNITIVIQGCTRQEHKYQKLLYENYYGYALKIVFRYIYRYENAVDIANDGFVKLFRYFERFEPGEDTDNEKILMGYIKRIMINCAIDELRKNKMTPEIGGIPEYVWDMSAKEQDADQLLLYKELITVVKNLPPQYRAVFNMYVIDGFNHIEIADIMGISSGTSRSYLSRGRELIQKEIRKNENTITCSM